MDRNLEDGETRYGAREERGVALILVLLIVTLLYIFIVEIVSKSEFDSLRSENQAVEVQMREALKMGLAELLQELADDTGEEASGGDMGGAAGGLGALAGAGGGAAAAAGEEEGAAGSVGDSSRDAWFTPKSYYDDNKITVYGFVEDENRKFNVLSLLSKDEDFAKRSKDRLIRLIDGIWEDTEEDVSSSDAETWAAAIFDWMRGAERNDDRPKMPLTSNSEENEIVIPLHLDELRMLPQIPTEVWDDRIVGTEVREGLSSVLTVHTSLRYEGESGDGADGEGGASAAAQGGEGSGAGEGDGEGESQVLGPGLRININTARPAVLYALEGEGDIPRTVIQAILRYRNEEDEEAQAAQEGEAQQSEDQGLYTEEGGEPMKKIFESLEDLDEVPEWKALPQNEAKDRFLAMLTTRSNVFTVHLAAVYKRDDAGKAYLVSRQRGVFLRAEAGEKQEMDPVTPMKRVSGIRLQMPDLPEDEMPESSLYEEDQNEFAEEERLWNPFFLDFYDPRKRSGEGR